VPLTFLLENTLERRKDMLNRAFIIPQIPPRASKIIKIYSIFPKTARPQAPASRFAVQNCGGFQDRKAVLYIFFLALAVNGLITWDRDLRRSAK
jgi:hypothetical protein